MANLYKKINQHETTKAIKHEAVSKEAETNDLQCSDIYSRPRFKYVYDPHDGDSIITKVKVYHGAQCSDSVLFSDSDTSDSDTSDSDTPDTPDTPDTSDLESVSSDDSQHIDKPITGVTFYFDVSYSDTEV